MFMGLSPPVIPAGGSGFVVFVVASPCLSLSQWVSQALSSLSSQALASHYHSGWLRLCRLCRRKPSPPTITVGVSGFVVFVVASPRLPLSQRPAQALSSSSSQALASHYHSGRLRLCRLCRRKPSPPTITVGGSGFVVFVVASPRLPLSQWVSQALSSLSSQALASHYHSGWLRLCRLCRRKPSPPTITVGGSGFVVFVVASPRLPLSQWVSQALSSLSSQALASHYRLCRRKPSPPTITVGGSGFVVFVVASPRLPLSQWVAQALSSLSSQALASHYHSGWLRLCRLCRRKPSPPTITVGGSGFIVFVVASPRLPLSQWVAQALSSLSLASPHLPLSQWVSQALSSLSSQALASHYHSGRLRLCRLRRRKPSPPTITVGGSGFVVFVVASPRLPLSQRPAQALSSLSSQALASHYHSGWLRLCRLCRRKPSPPTITAAGSGFVVFVVASPRLPLSQWVAQALSSLSSQALASHYHSGRLRLCRLRRRKPSPPTITVGGSGFIVFVVASPRLPPSQWVAQALSSLSSQALASHYHSGWLRLCCLCRRKPSPPFTVGVSGFVVFVVASPRLPPSSLSSQALASHYHSGWLRLCRLGRRKPSPPTITVESCLVHKKTSCRPNPQTDHLLSYHVLGSPPQGPTTYMKEKKGSLKLEPRDFILPHPIPIKNMADSDY